MLRSGDQSVLNASRDGAVHEDEENKKFFITWQFKTIPGTAVPDGTIQADLTVSGSAEFATEVLDGDLFDDPVSISFGVSYAGVGASIGWTVNNADTDEGTAACAAYFKSDSPFSENPPDASSNHLKDSSHPYYEINLPHNDSKSWSKASETITKSGSKDDKVEAAFVFHAFGRAQDAASETLYDSFGRADLTDMSITKNIANVTYIVP